MGLRFSTYSLLLVLMTGSLSCFYDVSFAKGKKPSVVVLKRTDDDSVIPKKLEQIRSRFSEKVSFTYSKENELFVGNLDKAASKKHKTENYLSSGEIQLKFRGDKLFQINLSNYHTMCHSFDSLKGVETFFKNKSISELLQNTPIVSVKRQHESCSK